MFNGSTNVKPTSADSTYVKSTSMAQTMSSSLNFILILGQPHGTGARQLQMSVDTDYTEFTFFVFSASLRVP